MAFYLTLMVQMCLNTCFGIINQNIERLNVKVRIRVSVRVKVTVDSIKRKSFHNIATTVTVTITTVTNDEGRKKCFI